MFPSPTLLFIIEWHCFHQACNGLDILCRPTPLRSSIVVITASGTRSSKNEDWQLLRHSFSDSLRSFHFDFRSSRFFCYIDSSQGSLYRKQSQALNVHVYLLTTLTQNSVHVLPSPLPQAIACKWPLLFFQFCHNELLSQPLLY